LGGLAAQAPQIVELCATYVAAAFYLDLVDDRAVQRERTLHAHAEAHLAHRERFTDTITGPADDHAGEDLDSRASALDDLDMHLDGIAWAEGGKIAAQR